MPPKKNKIKKNNKNIADDLSITLKDMQCKFGEESKYNIINKIF